MSLEIEEQLELRAPVERVWKFLIDPELEVKHYRIAAQ